MKSRKLLLPSVVALVALPLFVGFAGPEAAAGRWDRLERNSTRLVGELFSASRASADDGAPYDSYREALDAIEANYYPERVDSKKVASLTEAAIRGMLYTLNDPFTGYLDRDEWLQMQQTTQGEFQGIGAVLEQRGQDVVIVRLIPESPAFRSGLKAKDQVISVINWDGPKHAKQSFATIGMNINEVVKKIKGPKGTRVDVTVMRKAHTAPITFHLTRALVEQPTVQYWMEDSQAKIGHILLNEFNEKSDSQFDHAVEALRDQGMKALVFDLRFNPGGLLNVAVDMVGRFVDRGAAVVIQENKGEKVPLPVHGSRRVNHLPLVVLVNENSASASEIVAGAIKDYGVGTLVGEHTFGKGLVQTLFPLGGAQDVGLRLTTAKYFTPKLNDINFKYDDEHRPIFGTGGIKPDIEVKVPDDFDVQETSDENRRKDPQLRKALDILRTRLTQSATARRQ